MHFLILKKGVKTGGGGKAGNYQASILLSGLNGYVKKKEKKIAIFLVIMEAMSR